MPIFFVLSGFLISLTIIKSGDHFSPKKYLIKRAAKLYPPFIFSLLTFTLFYCLYNGSDNLIESAFAYLLTLPNFSNTWFNINPVYWSLLVEIHFYITFPILFFISKKIVRHPEILCACILMIIPVLIRLMHHLPPETPRELWFHNAQIFPRALDNFVLGIVFSHIFIHKQTYTKLVNKSAWIVVIGVTLLALCYLLAAYQSYGILAKNRTIGCNDVLLYETLKLLPCIATFMILFTVFLSRNFIVNRILEITPLKLTGLISYEWFLFHYPPAIIISKMIGNTDGDILMYLLKTVLPFAVTYLLAWFFYNKISNPLLKKVNRNLAERT